MEQESHTLPFLGKTRCEEDEQSPVEQVALTVPTTDDIEMPVVTFRMWTLGTISCVILSFMNQFFWYRNESLTITALSAQIAVLPLGRLMAKTLTKKNFFQGSRYEFSLNPGPFNMKEHVLITIFANAGAGGVYAIDIITAIKVFYKKELSFFVAFLVIITTQIIGFGWAGIFRKYLVEPSAMWWPENLVQVSLFRALHEEEKRPKRGLTRNQFFIIAVTCSFAYYVIPGYLIPMFTCASWICWLFPTSIIAQQIGSGLNGLGLGAIGLDWATISSYLGSPLATPWFAIVNVGVGFTLIIYVVTPLVYWLDIYDARKYPIFSKELFTSQGQVYNISMIINSNFQLDHDVYKKYGPLHLSTFFAMTYGFGFAALAATIVHVLLFHGKEIWHLKSSFRTREDIHTKLMRKYKQVPQSWFLIVLIASITLAIFSCEYYIDQLQLPWWGVLLACAIAIFFTLPIGVITATTNQSPGLNIISEYIIGYIYPERPVANICFKVYGWFSVIQSITFLQDFKLGHYLKIPPRAMYMAQMVGAVIASIVYLGTAWWMMNSVPNLCDSTLLAPNNHWTCPTGRVFYDASVIWGLIGPRRIFGSAGTYNAINWFFLVGAVAPFLVWMAHKKFPNKEWIKLINMPVLIGAIAVMPIATPVNYTSWLIMGFVFNFLIYRYRKKWWIRHNYVLSGALDVGLGFMAIVLYLCLELNGISFRWWGDRLDQCTLASCPTTRGVVVEGCPELS